MKPRVLALLPGLLLVGSPILAEQPDPLGGEFRVNTYTTENQLRPRVAHQPDGSFIVVWESRGSNGTDTDGSSIQGQRFFLGGLPVGNEFQVNTSTTYWQWGADIGTDAAGNFVVVWQSPHAGVDGGDFDIFGQRYLANGSAIGNEFPVNSYTTGRHEIPAIAVAPDGEFVVVWMSERPDTDDETGIRARRFEADATPIGDDFPVNTFTTDHQRLPAVAIDDEGDFVVVWQGDDSGGSDTDPINPTKSIHGQLFANDGSLVGGEFQVNTYTTDHQYAPSVAMDSDGDFVVVWDSQGSYGPDTNTSVQAQRYSADGTPLGSEFQVNTYIFGVQENAKVAMTSGGAFVVVWQSTGSYGSDVGGYSKHSVQMRRFSADGMAIGGDFQVNTYTTNQQWYPGVSAIASGEILVVWESPRDDPARVDRFGIYGQRFDEDLLFASGLEFGDLSGWSFTIP